MLRHQPRPTPCPLYIPCYDGSCVAARRRIATSELEGGTDTMGLAIIVHGGAGAMAPDRHEEAAAGCREAALAGWAILRQGGSALDAVQAAIVALEDNPGFNA